MTCQEQEQIQTLSEDRFTGKLRVWFNGEAVVLPTAVNYQLPWIVNLNGNRIICPSEDVTVAMVANKKDAHHIVNAANKHHALSTVVATVYNRIRRGDVLFDGSEADVRLWQEAKKLLEP